MVVPPRQSLAELLAVRAADAAHAEHAGRIAAELHVPMLNAMPAGGLVDGAADRYVLRVGAAGMALVSPHTRAEVCVDFLGGALRYRNRHGGGSGQLVAKAVGVRGGNRPNVLDATAGLGKDAFVLAGLGCRVELVERSAVLALLLQDALSRALASGDVEIAPVVARMRVIHRDARDVLRTLPGDKHPDVVYLDPMFPARDKSAAVKKDMQMLQDIIGKDDDASELLPLALAAARHRVVVKRPRHAAVLGGMAPSLSFAGKSSRFDVYTIKAFA